MPHETSGSVTQALNEMATLAEKVGRLMGQRDRYARERDEAREQVRRMREHVQAALDLNREMCRAEEHNDSPGNMQHAVLVAALGVADE